MTSSTSTGGWLVPFTLGATTALVGVWLNYKMCCSTATGTSTGIGSNTSNRGVEFLPVEKEVKTQPTQAPKKPTITTSSTSGDEKKEQQKQQQEPSQQGELMDSVDLDQRMLRKAEAVIQWRTSRLVLVVERCTNDHNYSAILRTAEALGIQVVHMIDPPPLPHEYTGESAPVPVTQQEKRQAELSTPEELEARRQHHLFARNATEWLTVRDHATSQDCVAELRREGYQLWVTDLSQEAQCLTMSDGPAIPEKVALVMGTEAVGCSQYILDEADLRVYLPLRGFADSLNLSVATALIIHQLFVMDPTLIGSMSSQEKLELRKAWYSKLCKQRILTSSQRKQRQKLVALVKKCQAIYDRSQVPGARALQPSEQSKLDDWDTFRQELADLDALVDPTKLEAAVQEWVENPPEPLTDVRRADAHRVCYVGKGTKGKHSEHWKDMVATSNSHSVHMSTASMFREKLQEQKTDN
eukprot:Nitzschia sp. Nitz4//scaffold291_size36643//28789//30195//NITZ4_007769-RA/size36643-processed-gene-0.31-mRNA-1//-1//CDS//3329546145//3982//frame0